jgi:saccharopine dehydrogenase-like NADP-dependent oxidoreductase
MRIVILGGAGLMGGGIVRDLLSERAIIPIESLRVCDGSRERLDRLLGTLPPDARIEPCVFDVTDDAALAAALREAQLCINAVPTLAGHQMRLFEAALAARIAYLDLGGLGTFTRKQLQAHARFVAAGVTAVIGAGSDPGMSNILCRAVADRLDQIERINLYWAAELVGEENPVLCPPYSVATVLAEYAFPSTQFLEGRHVECAPQSGREVLELPPPWGRCEFMYSPHSEQLTVPLAQGIKEKGIREFTWKLHLPHREHEAWLGLVKAGFGDFDEPLLIEGVAIKPVTFLEALIRRNIERHRERMPAQASHEIHFAVGAGRKDGLAKTVRCEVIVQPDPLYEGYVDACTSMNASIAAQLLLAAPLRPGVYAPEAYFDAARYLQEVERRRFQVRIS